MTDRSSDHRQDSALGKAPTSTNRLDHDVSTDLQDALAFLRQEDTDLILDRFTFTEDEIHFDTGEVPQMLVDLFADFIRGLSLLTADQAVEARRAGPHEAISLARLALIERGSL
jgi:hypothetical protein